MLGTKTTDLLKRHYFLIQQFSDYSVHHKTPLSKIWASLYKYCVWCDINRYVQVKKVKTFFAVRWTKIFIIYKSVKRIMLFKTPFDPFQQHLDN